MTSRFSTVYSQVQKCASLPKGSLLEKHGGAMASYVDCFHVVVTKKAATKKAAPSPSTHMQHKPSTNESSLLQPKLLQSPKVRSFVESFYASWTFYPESIVLWTASKFYQLPPLETTGKANTKKKKKKNGKEEPLSQPRLLSSSDDSFGYGFFRVLEETEQEMILDSGPTRTWMSIKKLEKKGDDDVEKNGDDDDDDEIEYAFGSIVKKELTFNSSLVISLHQWYSKILFAGAVCQHQSSYRK